jgi:hypothetical protein
LFENICANKELREARVCCARADFQRTHARFAIEVLNQKSKHDAGQCAAGLDTIHSHANVRAGTTLFAGAFTGCLDVIFLGAVALLPYMLR